MSSYCVICLISWKVEFYSHVYRISFAPRTRSCVQDLGAMLFGRYWETLELFEYDFRLQLSDVDVCKRSFIVQSCFYCSCSGLLKKAACLMIKCQSLQEKKALLCCSHVYTMFVCLCGKSFVHLLITITTAPSFYSHFFFLGKLFLLLHVPALKKVSPKGTLMVLIFFLTSKGCFRVLFATVR